MRKAPTGAGFGLAAAAAGGGAEARKRPWFYLGAPPDSPDWSAIWLEAEMDAEEDKENDENDESGKKSDGKHAPTAPAAVPARRAAAKSATAAAATPLRQQKAERVTWQCGGGEGSARGGGDGQRRRGGGGGQRRSVGGSGGACSGGIYRTMRSPLAIMYSQTPPMAPTPETPAKPCWWDDGEDDDRGAELLYTLFGGEVRSGKERDIDEWVLRDTAVSYEAFPQVDFWRGLDIRWLQHSYAHGGVGDALRRLKVGSPSLVLTITTP